MRQRNWLRWLPCLLFAIPVPAAAQEIGYIERYALAPDRASVLGQLIPDTEDYYYYHCLYYQTKGQLSDAQAQLDRWVTKFGETGRFQMLRARQMILTYNSQPDRTIQFLRDQIGANLSHVAPQRDRAAALATKLPPEAIDYNAKLKRSIEQDRSLGQIESSSIPDVLKLDLGIDQLRAWLQRVDRADIDGLVSAILRELNERDSGGFGSLVAHNLLTFAQLEELRKAKPELIEQDQFVFAMASRIRPNADQSLSDDATMLEHLARLESFADSLPPSKSSFKASVIFQRLKFDAKHDQFDRKRLLKYLAFPRRVGYFNPETIRKMEEQGKSFADLNSDYRTVTLLPPISDDTALVRQHLEHFFQSDANVDQFAPWIERGYLDRVFAETKILYGLGDSKPHYAKIPPAEQKELRDRVELRFASANPNYFEPDTSVALDVEVKNIPQLIVKIYRLNARNVLKFQQRPVATDIDLDGLVANVERTIDYSQPGDRRHREKLEFPELEGRGLWVVDILGGGQRSRALIQKGQLRTVQRLTDGGHLIKVIDESGKVAPKAHVELGERQFSADKDGNILIPYSQQPNTAMLMLVDGDFAAIEQFLHQGESYDLQAAFLVDEQTLLAGSKASVVIRAQLRGNGQLISPELLEDATLTIVATDQDNVPTTQTINDLKIKSAEALQHSFLVPQRLARLNFTISGRVHNQSLDVRQTVSTTYQMVVNQSAQSQQIADFYLQHSASGYRAMLLGRNGESMGRFPVVVSIKLKGINATESMVLATNAEGIIDLGTLDRGDWVQCSTDSIATRQFVLDHPRQDWPNRLHLIAGEPIELNWAGPQTEKRLSLVELRSGLPYASLSSSIAWGEGTVLIKDIAPGDYRLTDHYAGQIVEISVTQGPSLHGYWIGRYRMLQQHQLANIAIKKLDVNQDKFVVQLSNFDELTRVHVVATTFDGGAGRSSRFFLPRSGVMLADRSRVPSFYLDSLKLDEEYRYILQRQYAKKYSGNLLPQPSVLLNPWELSATSNDRKDAAAGDELAKMQAATADAPMAAPGEVPASIQASALSSSFEFLFRGGVELENLKPDSNGLVAIDRKLLDGLTSVTVYVVHPFGTHSRSVALESDSALKTVDQRLAKAFPSDSHRAERQKVKILPAGEKVDLGDARTTRVRVFSTLGDLYSYYGTLLGNPVPWQKFQVLTRWSSLSEAEKLKNYNELACHELHLFLYNKDRAFFDKFVRGYLQNKGELQLVDRWLLEQELDSYQRPWQWAKLNSLELALLAHRDQQQAIAGKRFLNDWVAAHPIDLNIRAARFSAGLVASELDLGQMGRTLTESLDRFGVRDESRPASDKLSELEERSLGRVDPQSAAAVRLGAMFGTGGMPGGGGGGMGGMRGMQSGGMMGGGEGGSVSAPADASGSAPRDSEQLGQKTDTDAPAKQQNWSAEYGLAPGIAGKPVAPGGDVYFNKAEGEVAEELDAKGLATKENSLELRRYRRGAAEGRQITLFRTLEQTRKWAETNYYQVGLQSQGRGLVAPSAFWKDYLSRSNDKAFLSENVDIPTNNFNEALAALAVIDLPMESKGPELAVEEGRLTVKTPSDAIAFVRSIEPTTPIQNAPSILVGQDIYLLQPSADANTQRPVKENELIKGVAYRASVVVTNPTGQNVPVQALSQVPEGAIVLAGRKVTVGQPLQLGPYSSQQIEYSFYFPSSGEFEHYGAQVSNDEGHVTAVDSRKLRVLDQPENVDQSSWAYIADWGTDDQVIAYIETANLQQVDLARIAFRMQKREFYDRCISTLSKVARYDDTLWAYSLLHKDLPRMREYLEQKEVLAQLCGPVFTSDLMTVRPEERFWYEQLDFRPLVVARSHTLGNSRVILNDGLAAQYNSLLSTLAFQDDRSDSQELALVYYFIVQNRIEDAIEYFNKIDASKLTTKLQYDYFTAYLDFHLAKYDHAAEIAAKYEAYEHPRWRDLFGQVANQIRQREAIQSGVELAALTSTAPSIESDQQLLVDNRENTQSEAAQKLPAFDLRSEGGRLTLAFKNLTSVKVNYYLMDIELLFSRNPFVQQDAKRLASIQPNRTEELPLAGGQGAIELAIPNGLENRNMLVEVTAEGITRSEVLYANALDVTLVSAFGRVQVLSRQGRQPLETAYVKVYARHQDGSVKFYKDGYTDLRGQFDYATLSTSDLDTVTRFAVLVIHPEHGAIIREVEPPQR